MTVKIESTTVIARPPEEVFAFLLDLENAAQFDPDVQSVKKTTEGPIGVGTEFRFYERTPPFGTFQRTRFHYTAVEPDHRIAFTGQVGPLAPVGSFTFENASAGTRVTFHGEANPKGFLKLFTPLIAHQGRRTWDKRLAHLKTWLERQKR